MEETFNNLCNKPSDINEHLPTLFKYAKECESIIELGVRGCVSSWAFGYGLLKNEKDTKKLLMNDLNECNVDNILIECIKNGIDAKFILCNDLDLTVDSNYDMTFIDTWHVYGHLKRELEKFSQITSKYIIMHDTTIDEYIGETIRAGLDAEMQSKDTGIPVEDIKKGLWPAIEEFLQDHPEWKLHERFTNNNGLTILKRYHM